MTFEESNGAKILSPGIGDVFRVTSDYHADRRKLGLATEIAVHQLRERGRIFPESFPQYLLPVVPYIGTWILPSALDGKVEYIQHHVEAGDGISAFPISKKDQQYLDQSFQNLLEIMQISGINGDIRTFMPGNHTPFHIMPPALVDHLYNSGMAADKVKISLGNGSIISVRHGHEFDPRKSGDKSGFNNPIYTWLDKVWQLARKTMNLNRLPYDEPINRALMAVMDAHHIVRATAGLGRGNGAIDGHTHFPYLSWEYFLYDNLIDPKDVLSERNILGIIDDHPIAKAVFLLLRKLLPTASGANLGKVNNETGIFYGNTGHRDADGLQTAIDLHIGNEARLIVMDTNRMLNGEIWQIENPAFRIGYRVPLQLNQENHQVVKLSPIEV